MLTLYGCQIESKANLIQSAALKIGKVSMAELPLATKYLLRVIHQGYKDKTYFQRCNGDVRSPIGKVSAEHNEKIEEGGYWLCACISAFVG